MMKTDRERLLSETLRQAVLDQMSDGIRLRFAPSSQMLSTIARAVQAERHSAGFFDLPLSLNQMVGRFSRSDWASRDARVRHSLTQGVSSNVAVFAIIIAT